MRKKITDFKHFVFAITWLALLGGPATADVINYGNRAGTNVAFEGICEISLGGGPMFGPPTASGDMLHFNGFGFTSAASDDSDFGQGRLEMTIRAVPGFEIESVEVSEFGSYFLFGNGATAINNSLGFVQADGSMFNSGFTFSESATGAGAWSDWFKIEFPATDVIRLVLDSQIFTSAGAGEVAFLDKNGITISIGTVSAIPEPSGLLVILMGVCLGVVTRRRTRKRWKT